MLYKFPELYKPYTVIETVSVKVYITIGRDQKKAIGNGFTPVHMNYGDLIIPSGTDIEFVRLVIDLSASCRFKIKQSPNKHLNGISPYLQTHELSRINIEPR